MYAIQGDLIFTGTGVVRGGTIQVEGTTLAAGEGGELRGSYPVITPAFIDPHCHIGLVRGGEPAAEAEGNEHMDAMLGHADVLDSIQMDDSGFQSSIESGVLYSCVVPGSGNIISGRSAVIRNYGTHTNAALIRRAGIKGAFGFNPMSTRDWKGTRPYTRMGALAILRARLHEVRAKMAKEAAKPDADVTYSAEDIVLKSLLSGAERLRVHVHKSDDVDALLRFVDEFGLTVTVEHTCDVYQRAVYDELKARGIPVIYGPMDTLAYKVELKHENWRNIRHLVESGIQFGLMTDHPVILQRMLFFQLRWFMRVGLSKQQAIEVITRQNAEVLGIADVLGSLEAGKWASFVCWNGDPFSLESYPVAVYAEGQEIYRAEG
jgi:imidazolonepropionase-like amidohydrolase